MSQLAKEEKQGKVSFLEKSLNSIERVGNKLPDPVSIFVILSVVIMIGSAIGASMGLSAIHPSTNEAINVVNLLEKANLKVFLGSIVSNFQGFAPLGLVLVTMLGAGVTEKTGLIEAAMKQSVSKVPKQLLSVTIIFTGIVANAAADAGFIVLPPLAALVFMGVGRHPLIGMFAAYAGVAAGFSANIMVSMIDALLVGFTGPAAQLIKPDYVANPAMNMYFLFISAIILSIVGAYITEKFVAPRFGEYKGEGIDNTSKSKNELTKIEKKGLRNAGVTVAILAIILILLSIGENAFLLDDENGKLLTANSGLIKGIVPIITLLFLIPGIVYGITVGNIKNDKDLVSLMGSSMSDMGPYIVLAFFAGQFLYLFGASNIGVVLSIKGAQALQTAGMTGVELIVSFVILSAFINLFMGSASAKWAIMAPVFVPMFLALGYDPALTQMAYRIGDSITNPLSPIFSYFPVLLAFAKKYDKKLGIGTIISNMLPYSVAFAIVWIIMLVVFIQFNIPLGPGGGIYLK